jgi:hypothetical protein
MDFKKPLSKAQIVGILAIASLLIAIVAFNSFARSTPVKLQLPANLDPTLKTQIEKGWPKILEICPGFKKYGDEMMFDRIDDKRGMGKMSRIDIVFKVVSETKSIPIEYRAFGQTCYYGLGEDGKSLRVGKGSCLSICKDIHIETNGVDHVDLLR